MSPEQLLLLAALALVWVVSAIVQWLRSRQRAEDAPVPTAPPGARVPPPDGWVEPARVRPPEAARPPVVVAREGWVGPPVARPPAPTLERRRPAAVRLDGPADARRAIVLMTILGPCRALERERREP
jgi:hypothetical protein